VQRRILFGCTTTTGHHEAKYQKCAKVVGTIMGQYHPHGDVAIYDALGAHGAGLLAALTRWWTARNFGSLDGDGRGRDALHRVPARALASELLTELSKRTIDYGRTTTARCSSRSSFRPACPSS